ncbi:MAG TPA: RNA ligase family protein [Bryobacteraceae bacterium]|nr:RNA ligase family protein [Bryobacteraceae bacterium]
MMPILKYPRTPHLSGSRLQPGDEDLKVIARETLVGQTFVIEEKVDGSNTAISFDEDGGLVLQSRGHLLTGGPRERQFDLFKRWANHHCDALRRILGRRYVMYGEWLYARHTISYDRLPHYFLEFDILDRESGSFLDTQRRRDLLSGSPVLSVPVLAVARIRDIESYIGPSRFSSAELIEGLYLKREENGVVTDRYKFVRPGFLQAVVDSGSHWMDRPIEPNGLLDGVDLFA